MLEAVKKTFDILEKQYRIDYDFLYKDAKKNTFSFEIPFDKIFNMIMILLSL